MARGLRELVRVTRPGGRVLIVAFGPLRQAEFLTFFLGAVRAAVPGFTGCPLTHRPCHSRWPTPTDCAAS